MTFISAVILLGILIFVHELGHFLFAKAMKVKVLKFSLGFGPRVVGRRYGETEYLISAVPLGGYVKMLGEDHEDEVSPGDLKRAFHFQSVWKRFLIVVAGPVFNVFFAAVVFFGLYLTGVPVLLPEVGEVSPDGAAVRAGILKGDRITAIDGTRITRWDEMTGIIHRSPGRELRIEIRRGTETLVIPVAPERKAAPNLFGEMKEVGLIGIKPSGAVMTEREGPVRAVGHAFLRTWDIVVLTVVSIVKIIQRIIPAETIGGPILIFQMAGEQAAHGPMSFFAFMAVISINLGVANLLPIPILDGGHLLFLVIEKIRRRPLSEKTMMVAQRIGLAMIITLMIFAFYNDIMRLVMGKTTP